MKSPGTCRGSFIGGGYPPKTTYDRVFFGRPRSPLFVGSYIPCHEQPDSRHMATEPTHQTLSLKALGPRLSNGRWSAELGGCSVSRPLSLVASELLSFQASEPTAYWPLAMEFISSAAQRPLSLQASKPLSQPAPSQQAYKPLADQSQSSCNLGSARTLLLAI